MKPKIYSLILTIFLLVIQYTTFAQTTELAAWDFASGNTTPVLTTGISSASISVGGSLQRSYALTNSFLFTNIWATSQSLALNGNGTMAAQYISFTITPTANYSMDIASIGIQGYNPVLNHGKGFLPAYVDPITGNLVQLTSQAQNVNTVTLNPTFTIPLTNITTPIEFRFYIYSYPPYPSDIVGFGEQPGADLVINGNVHNSSTQVIPGTWSLQGNTVTGTQFLGSINNQDVVIYTNNAEKMRIGANGNVGIGTNTLAQKLNVAGDLGITGDFYKNGIKLDFSSLGSWIQSGFQDLNPNSSTYNQTLGQLSNTPFKQKIGLNAGVVEINAAVSAWLGISVGGRNQYSTGGPDLINNLPAYGIALNQSTGIVQVAGYNGINFVDNTFGTAPALSIQNGSIGVGISTQPTQKLEVNGNIKIDGATNGIIFPDGSKISTATAVGGGWGMSGGYNTYAGNANVQGSLKIGTGSMVLNGKTTSPVIGTAGINEIFSDAVADPLYLNKSVNANTILNQNGGNVGIGIAVPLEKLHIANGNLRVDGTLIANQINLTGAVNVNGKVTASSFNLSTGATNGYFLESDAAGNASWGEIRWANADRQVPVYGLPDAGGTIHQEFKCNYYSRDPVTMQVTLVSTNISGYDDSYPFDYDPDFPNTSLVCGSYYTTDKITYSTADYTGIGTTNPVAKLHVSGDVKIDGPITVSGNVGIGVTTAPTNKLEVLGTTKLTGTLNIAAGDFVLGTNDGRTIGTNINQRALVHANWGGLGAGDNLIINFTGDFEGGVNIQGPKVLIDGSLGIGVNPTTSQLEVAGSARLSGNIVFGTNNSNYIQFPDGTKQYTAGSSSVFTQTGDVAQFSTSANPMISLLSSGSNAAGFMAVADVQYAYSQGAANIGDVIIGVGTINPNSAGSGTKNLIIANQSVGKNILFATRNATGDHTAMKIDANGKVSIGQTNTATDALFSVGGYAYAMKNIVTQHNWADDEFAVDAKTPTLEEEELTAAKEQHLLGVPTETELKEKGLDLGEMQAIQMRKIEQLYKHMWKMNQRMEELEKENAVLKSKLK